jgi:microsomal dipeptidase-like Zn-dependent dipeptidase
MVMPPSAPILIDGLQFCRWTRETFEQMRVAGMSAIHATIGYHGAFHDAVRSLIDWNTLFRDHADLILHGRGVDDIRRARESARTAVFLGLQTPMPIEDDLGLVEVLHSLGVRFLQLTYNNQSLLGSGWMEETDSGLTRMGREVVFEMNRLGFIIDMSHAGERTVLETIAASRRPIAISHANPTWWCATRRNVSRSVLSALAASGGMLGLSLYPHHMRDGSETTLIAFCTMAAMLATEIGVENIGIGSDLCQDQPDSMVQWMRAGRWLRPNSALSHVSFPPQPEWFRDNRDFPRLANGLADAGFTQHDIGLVLGGNWHRFMQDALVPAPPSAGQHGEPKGR